MTRAESTRWALEEWEELFPTRQVHELRIPRMISIRENYELSIEFWPKDRGAEESIFDQYMDSERVQYADRYCKRCHMPSQSGDPEIIRRLINMRFGSRSFAKPFETSLSRVAENQ
jgi:hypothetical protein